MKMLNAAALVAAFSVAMFASGGADRYKHPFAPRGTRARNKRRRYMSGYNPPMSGSGVGGDRLSHRLGRP